MNEVDAGRDRAYEGVSRGGEEEDEDEQGGLCKASAVNKVDAGPHRATPALFATTADIPTWVAITADI